MYDDLNDDNYVLGRSASLPACIPQLPLGPLEPLDVGRRTQTPNTDPGFGGLNSASRTLSTSSHSTRPLIQQNSLSSNAGVLMRTTSGFQIGLLPPEQLRELQCGVCHNLIQNAVHAPCGHSFCQVHLEVDENARNELEIQAQRIRELVIDGRFNLSRAREALAVVQDGPLEEAMALCDKLSGLEGRVVRVRPDVKEPRFEWGVITHKSIGIVMKDEASQDGDRQAWVQFPEYNRWHCLTEELEIFHPADALVRKGTRVRVIAGVTPKLPQYWNQMEVDTIGTVFGVVGCQVRFIYEEGVHVATLDELEVAEKYEDPVAGALDRLHAGQPKELALRQLHGFLKEAGEAENSSDVRLVVQGRDYHSFMRTFGAFDMLKAIGLEITHYSKNSLYVFRYVPPPLGTDNLGPVPMRAICALEQLKKRFAPLPEPAPPPSTRRFRVDLLIDPDFISAIPVEEVYQEQLRHAVLAAIAPSGENWSWPQRGWDTEKAMRDNLVIALPSGRAPIARNQTEEEAHNICKRIVEQSLTASVEEEEFDPLVQSQRERCLSWHGKIHRGARVRFTAAAEGLLPESLDRTSIAIVNGQVLVGEGGNRKLHYFLIAPKTPFMKPVPAEAIELATIADYIQPGVRVRVNPPQGKEPVFGWGRVQGSDIGVVQNVSCDGAVEVFFIAEEQLWKGALQDLGTQDLPQVVRTNCPVCMRPFPSGQKLAVDIAMEAQIRRMQNLLAGARLEKNPDLSPKEKSSRPAKLLRSRTHEEELRCNICFDLLVSPVTLPCGHSYCKHHIQIWLAENDKCPVCRVRVLHYKDQPAQPKHALRTTAAVFQAMLEDEEGKGGQKQEDDGLELHVNEMLEKQVIRFFPEEVKQRSHEVAAEIWDVIQKRQDGSLSRLRNFLQQFRVEGARELLELSADGPDQPLPGMRKGTLLMVACEQGLTDVAELLLESKADPLHTTQAAFGLGTSSLQLASGQGKADVVKMLLGAATWPAQLCADALGAAIERNQVDCAQLLLQQDGVAEARNVMDFTAMLTAVQAGHGQIVSLLTEWKVNLEARTAHSGLMVSKAGCAKVNGPYQHIGEMNARPLYANLLGAVVYCKDWWKIAESRELAERTEEPLGFIYSMPAPHTETPEPPIGQWTMDGVRPDPHRPPPMPAPLVERLAEAEHAATPLLLAAQLGLGSIADLLIQAQADPDARLPGTKRSALHIAASKGDLGVVKVLISDSCKSLDKSPVDAAELAPLHLACHSGHTIVAQTLINGNEDSSLLQLALCVAAGCGYYPLEIEACLPGAASSYLAIVTALLDAKADPCISGPLQAAGSAGDIPIVTELVERRANPSASDTSGLPPLLATLMKASRSPASKDGSGPQAEAARKLLELRADASANRSSDNFTALMAASAVGGVGLCQELVKARADLAATRGSCMQEKSGCTVAARDRSGWKVIDTLLHSNKETSLAFPGEVLCLRGHAMERLTKERCNRKPVCDKCRIGNIHSSAVFWTCWPCDHDLCVNCASVPPIVRLPPMCSPADISTDSRLPEDVRAAFSTSGFVSTLLDGWQPLHHAVVAERKGAAKALLDAKALASTPDLQGFTPLHWAVMLGHYDIIELLLESGANPEAVDSEGKAPLAWMGIEPLRYAFVAESTDFKHIYAHEIVVMDSGSADGEYVIILIPENADTKDDPKPGSETPLTEGMSPEQMLNTVTASDVAGQTVETAASTLENATVDSQGEIASSELNVVAESVAQGTTSAAARPQYRRKDGAPYVLKWTEEHGWGIWQLTQRHDHKLLCFVNADKESWYCPPDGWKVSDQIQIDGDLDIKVTENNPWRVGTRLFRCTPPSFRPPDLRQMVEQLPVVEVKPEVQTQVSFHIGPGMVGPGMTIPVPAGMLLPGMPGGRSDQLFQTVMEEMMRGGNMPLGMGPPTGMLGPPGCPQQ